MRRIPAVHLAISDDTTKPYDRIVNNLNSDLFFRTFSFLMFDIISDELRRIAYSEGGSAINNNISQVTFTFFEVMIHEKK